MRPLVSQGFQSASPRPVWRQRTLGHLGVCGATRWQGMDAPCVTIGSQGESLDGSTELVEHGFTGKWWFNGV